MGPSVQSTRFPSASRIRAQHRPDLCHAAAAGPRIAAARADRIICAFVAGERLTDADHPDRGRRSRQTFPGVCSEGNDASRAHPAGGPRNSRPAPRIPATARLESPAHGPNPRPCPLSPEAPRPACHIGGRGSRPGRSRFLKGRKPCVWRGRAGACGGRACVVAATANFKALQVAQ
jgi:hypothetical protein